MSVCSPWIMGICDLWVICCDLPCCKVTNCLTEYGTNDTHSVICGGKPWELWRIRVVNISQHRWHGQEFLNYIWVSLKVEAVASGVECQDKSFLPAAGGGRAHTARRPAVKAGGRAAKAAADAQRTITAWPRSTRTEGRRNNSLMRPEAGTVGSLFFFLTLGGSSDTLRVVLSSGVNYDVWAWVSVDLCEAKTGDASAGFSFFLFGKKNTWWCSRKPKIVLLSLTGQGFRNVSPFAALSNCTVV